MQTTIGHYLERFRAAQAASPAPPFVRLARESAMSRLAELGFPRARDEDWRATPAAPLAEVPFEPAEPAPLGLAELERLVPAPLLALPRLVFVNGRLAAGLSTPIAGVEAASLAQVLARDPARASALFAPAERDFRKPFVALNSAFFADGAFVSIPEGVRVEQPIHLVFVTRPAGGGGGGPPAMAVPRTWIAAGARSRAVVVESYLGGAKGTFTNATSEIRLADSASLSHYRLQREERSAFHLGVTSVEQGRGSRLRSFVVAEGGALARHELEVRLAGEGASCQLDGLSLISSGQLIDQHTFLDHAVPRCASDELYKGILDGTARGVFHGRVLVRPGAQKTDARQASRNLLLTPQAQVDARPQLEIHADDVKCSHGAVTGQLDRDALFYLRSRGVGEAEARAMLTEAFAGEVIRRMDLAPFRQAVEAALRARLAGAGEEEEMDGASPAAWEARGEGRQKEGA